MEYYIETLQSFFEIQNKSFDKKLISNLFRIYANLSFSAQLESVCRELNIVCLFLSLPVEKLIAKNTISFVKEEGKVVPILILKICDNKITYNLKGDIKTSTKENFLSIYTGKSAFLEDLHNNSLTQQKGSYEPLLIKFIYFISFLFSIYFCFVGGFFLTLFFITHIIGIVISYSIVTIQKLGETAATIPFCRKNQCKNLIQKQGEWKLLGTVALIYFGANMVFIGFSLTTPIDTQNILSYLSIPIALLVVPASLIKMLISRLACRLCLFINLVLIIQLICGVINFNWLKLDDAYRLIPVFSQYFLTVLITIAIVKVIIDNMVLKTEKDFFQLSVHRNFYTQEAFISRFESSLIVDSIFFDSDIVIGDSSSKNEILLILDKNCSPCLELVKQLSNQIAHYNDKLIFHLRIRILGVNTKEFTTIHPVKNYSNFKEKVNREIKYLSVFLENKKNAVSKKKVVDEEISNWVNSLSLNYVPIVIVNNRLLPKGYDLSHVNKFLLMKTYKEEIINYLNR